MASWKEERDRLVAQTLAFVQEVAAAHPVAAQRLKIWQPPTHTPSQASGSTEAFTSPAITNADHSTTPALIVETANAAIETSERSSQDIPVAVPTNVPSPARRDPLYSGPSERAEILKRVASFKARQAQMIHERDVYYEAMQTRIRTTLRNDSGRDRL
ncbi:hypothetical protein SAMN03159423_2581 [Bradyrhizobium sp. NFR13]|uniref:hypothetical protein n=1 Tax=Bradyrhizobium sp. NFR13 TaxID=1566285 RepID=UPI0008F2DCBB|nr:hypothetical protein [Bradyrhizobium sp. NFR13]SFL57494.1 hypothetical protein SAMN03159423_2581 [Bradyrhizobium sp. NFR13]